MLKVSLTTPIITGEQFSKICQDLGLSFDKAKQRCSTNQWLKRKSRKHFFPARNLTL